MSQLRENFSMAFQSLFANPMRSALTMLGIIVGIASVITIVAVGQGTRSEIIGQFSDLGASTTIIMVNSGHADQNDYITDEDLIALREQIPNLRYAAPASLVFGNADTLYGSATALMCGIQSDGFAMLSPSLKCGRSFTEIEYEDGRFVAIIDSYTANTYFKSAEGALNQVVEAQFSGHRASFQIIGVVDFAGMSLMSSLSSAATSDSIIPLLLYTPFNSLSAMTGETPTIPLIAVMAEEPDMTELVAERARALIEQRHGNAGQGLYQLKSVAGILGQLNYALDLVTVFISIVAAISLVVGGIGVMNIMLVSVTERTREIGIRKSLGAPSHAIAVQFLTESVILTTVGGLVGILIGMLGSYLLGKLIGIYSVVSWGWTLTSLLFSASIGLFFGIYPAQKAASMNPIDALRYE